MWQKSVRYLDHNASSGVSGSVRKKLIEFLERTDFRFANPSSQHRLGQQSQQLFLKAAMKIASSFGKDISSNDLVFCSSGTEANQTVLRSAMKTHSLVIIGAGEHGASHDLIQDVPEGVRCIELPLLSNGQYDLEFLQKFLIEEERNGQTKVFLSLFWANNETGVITPLKPIESILRSCGLEISLHLDGAQVWGKLHFDLAETPADYVTFSSHKIGAPAGTGVIWIRPGAKLIPLLHGTQAKGRRGGTENLIGALATSFAVEEINPAQFADHVLPLRERLESGIRALASETDESIKIWSTETARIPNTSRISFSGFDHDENWVQLLDLKGFAVSHGSACQSKVINPSRVLLAMGASHGEALNTIRVSFGLDSQESDVDELIMALREILREKRGRS
jgi:cysteine desulfurase